MRARALPIALIVLLTAAAPSLAVRLSTVRTKHYDIATDLTKTEVREIGRHMDAVADAYTRMLSSFRIRNAKPNTLFIFRDREDYIGFMRDRGFNARNTGGVFFVRQGESGLATWYEGRSKTQMWHILQHEGFHQFAHSRIGGNFPIWANEGLAEYFGHSLLVRDHLKTGIAPAHRLEAVQRAIREGFAFDFESLIHMTGDDWSHRVQVGGPRSGLLYDQSWSIAHFLIHADDGKYAPAFERFIRLTGQGRSTHQALEEAFGTTDLAPFEAAWRAYMLGAQPDPVSVAVDRLEFMAAGLGWLFDEGIVVTELDQLETLLERHRFEVTVSQHGLIRRKSAADGSWFDPPPNDRRGEATYELDPPRGHDPDEPATVRVTGMSVGVSIVWSRDSGGELSYDIVIR